MSKTVFVALMVVGVLAVLYVLGDGNVQHGFDLVVYAVNNFNPQGPIVDGLRIGDAISK